MREGSAGRVDRARGRAPRRSSLPTAPTVLLAALVVAAGALASCSSEASETAAPTNAGPASSNASSVPAPPATLAAGDPDGARLRITEDLTGCCYPAGHVSWLLVLDADGAVIVQRHLRPPADPFPVVDVVLAPGPYHVVSAQQACGATCAAVGDVVDRCEADLELASATTTYLTVGVDPGGGCAVVLAAAPLPAPVADEVALPGAEVDCGFDASLAEAAATGRNVVLSEGRRCLADAVQRGASAWLQADEPTDAGPGLTAMVVYRLDAGGTVDVYQVVDPAAPVRAWIRSSCTDVAPDEVRAFLVRGCTAPEAVPWQGSA